MEKFDITRAALDDPDAFYVRHLRRSVVYEDDELPSDEFKEIYQGRCCPRARGNASRDLYSYASGIKSLYEHLAFTEFIVIMLASLGMTLFFSYYLYPGPTGDYHLAARMRFNIIVTAVLFPSTMLVAETMARRDQALRRFATIKSEMCQILDAFLSWRAPNVVMTPEWEEHAHQCMTHVVVLVYSILLQPTIRDRHAYTSQGRIFADTIRERTRELKNKVLKANFKMHCLVEDLKEAGLSPMESIRLFQYIQIFSTSLEVVFNIKHYRTNRSSRTFSRIVLTSCIMFYGPYYSFLAGAMAETYAPGGYVNLAFSCVLTVVSTLVLLAIVAQHRASEDPFMWHSHGNAIDVSFEARDILMKMEGMLRIRRDRRRESTRKSSTVEVEQSPPMPTTK